MKLTKSKGCPAHTYRLYKAVNNYIEKEGGGVVVIGGIQIIKWPNDPKLFFTIGIKCVGKEPVFKNQKT